MVTPRGHGFILSICLFNDLDSSNITAVRMGKMADLSKGKIKRYSSKALEECLLIHSGDNKGYELIEADQDSILKRNWTFLMHGY